MGTRKNDRGIAHPLFILLAVVVIAAIGAAGYMVYKHQQDSGGVTTANANASAAAKTAIKTEETSCTNALHDKTLCKFAANFEMPKAYEATITTTGSSSDGTMVMDTDNSGNTKITMTKDGKESLATITLSSATYIKDETSGSWISYPGGSSSSSSTSSTSSGVKFDKTNWTESGTMSYKAAGKEACGSLTCYKYQIISTKDSGTTQYVWFDTKDFMMRKFQSHDSSGTMDMSLNYKTITISAPSPVIDYTSAQNTLDTSSALDQLNALGSSLSGTGSQ